MWCWRVLRQPATPGGGADPGRFRSCGSRWHVRWRSTACRNARGSSTCCHGKPTDSAGFKAWLLVPTTRPSPRRRYAYVPLSPAISRRQLLVSDDRSLPAKSRLRPRRGQHRCGRSLPSPAVAGGKAVEVIWSRACSCGSSWVKLMDAAGCCSSCQGNLRRRGAPPGARRAANRCSRSRSIRRLQANTTAGPPPGRALRYEQSGEQARDRQPGLDRGQPAGNILVLLLCRLPSRCDGDFHHASLLPRILHGDLILLVVQITGESVLSSAQRP